MPLWPALIPAYLGGSYYETVVRQPAHAAREAKAHADRLGKPFGDIGCGTAESSARVAFFGPTAVDADVSCDPSAPKSTACGPGHVCFCNAYDLSQFPDRYFGAVLASHFLANLERPQDALRELLRVSDRVYVVLPKWWAPGSWFSPATEHGRARLGMRRWLASVPRVEVR